MRKKGVKVVNRPLKGTLFTLNALFAQGVKGKVHG